MNGNNKIWASVAGVSVTAAVVIGAALGVNAHHAPAQRPAGHPAPLASTVTVTASARPAAAAPAAVSPSKAKAVPHRRHKTHRAVVVVNQEPPVTESSPPDPATSSDPGSIDLGPGTVDEGGVRRAPGPTAPHPAHPTNPNQAAPPPAPSPSS